MTQPVLISAEELAQQSASNRILILDLSSRENYLKGHIPGAIYVDAAKLLKGHGDIANKLPDPEQLSELFSSLGLKPEHRVVVYDDQMGPWAGRMVWTLHCAGHQNCAVLDGQLSAWQQAGFALETRVNEAEPTQVEVTVDSSLVADIAYITAHLNSPDHIVLDVRSAAEYSGEKVINARKGGHIPGAVNYEWTRALIAPDNPKLRAPEALLKELEALGVTPDKTVITHCQTHRRSGLSYLFTKHLGFDKVRCYDGSWFEWGNRDDTPVES